MPNETTHPRKPNTLLYRNLRQGAMHTLHQRSSSCTTRSPICRIVEEIGTLTLDPSSIANGCRCTKITSSVGAGAVTEENGVSAAYEASTGNVNSTPRGASSSSVGDGSIMAPTFDVGWLREDFARKFIDQSNCSLTAYLSQVIPMLFNSMHAPLGLQPAKQLRKASYLTPPPNHYTHGFVVGPHYRHERRDPRGRSDPRSASTPLGRGWRERDKNRTSGSDRWG